MGYFGSGVGKDFSEKDMYKSRSNSKKRPACRILGESMSDRGSYCCDNPEDLASGRSTMTKAYEQSENGQKAGYIESCRPPVGHGGILNFSLQASGSYWTFVGE